MTNEVMLIVNQFRFELDDPVAKYFNFPRDPIVCMVTVCMGRYDFSNKRRSVLMWNEYQLRSVRMRAISIWKLETVRGREIDNHWKFVEIGTYQNGDKILILSRLVNEYERPGKHRAMWYGNATKLHQRDITLHITLWLLS